MNKHIEEANFLITNATNAFDIAGATEVHERAAIYRRNAEEGLALATVKIDLAQAESLERLATALEIIADLYERSRPF